MNDAVNNNYQPISPPVQAWSNHHGSTKLMFWDRLRGGMLDLLSGGTAADAFMWQAAGEGGT